MKGIIIAAGPSKRLRPLTDDKPKCMLKIEGKPIIQNTIELFRSHGINDISVVRGWMKDKINFSNITYFENTDFWNNNILHSLMFARQKLEEAASKGEEVVITYSDIWYNDIVVSALLKSKEDIACIVDTDWQEYYDGRTEHPITEAENIILDGDNRILRIGKHVIPKGLPKARQGEFIGLWKFTSQGLNIFVRHFDKLNAKLNKIDPYQNAKEWQKSYITDIFQEMIDKGEEIHAVLIQRNWKEFDTVQDFIRVGGQID